MSKISRRARRRRKKQRQQRERRLAGEVIASVTRTRSYAYLPYQGVIVEHMGRRMGEVAVAFATLVTGKTMALHGDGKDWFINFDG